MLVSYILISRACFTSDVWHTIRFIEVHRHLVNLAPLVQVYNIIVRYDLHMSVL